jgi:hypothetical protein
MVVVCLIWGFHYFFLWKISILSSMRVNQEGGELSSSLILFISLTVMRLFSIWSHMIRVFLFPLRVRKQNKKSLISSYQMTKKQQIIDDFLSSGMTIDDYVYHNPIDMLSLQFGCCFGYTWDVITTLGYTKPRPKPKPRKIRWLWLKEEYPEVFDRFPRLSESDLREFLGTYCISEILAGDIRQWVFYPSFQIGDSMKDEASLIF